MPSVRQGARRIGRDEPRHQPTSHAHWKARKKLLHFDPRPPLTPPTPPPGEVGVGVGRKVLACCKETVPTRRVAVVTRNFVAARVCFIAACTILAHGAAQVVLGRLEIDVLITMDEN